MESARPAETSSHGRRIVQADDLQALYELVRGSPYANSLVEAQDAFAAGDFALALSLINTVRGQYAPKHQRLVTQYEDEQQKKRRPDPKLQSRIDKIRQTLELFEAVIPGLERVAKVQPPKQLAAAETSPARPDAAELSQVGMRAGLPDALREALLGAKSPQEARAAIEEYCEIGPVDSLDDLVPNGFYRLDLKNRVHVIRISSRLPITSVVPIRHGLTEQPLKPLALDAFLTMGRGGSLVRIVPREVPASATHEEPLPLGLNMGDFSQLMDAAQHSGLVPNSDAIAHLRDREFRIGEYQKALQDMEAIFGKFVAAAAQREQRIRREETDIKSGKLQMSARDLQIKRARDQADSQRIARARRRFQRVLEGLRMLTSKTSQ